VTDRLTGRLSETPEAALEREPAEEAKLRLAWAPPLVLRGAGHLAQSVLTRLLETDLDAEALADENPARLIALVHDGLDSVLYAIPKNR
jgi:hypothetical protein